MSTSAYAGIVDFASSLYGSADDPVDAVMMADGVANGLHHLADSSAQVRCNYWPIDSSISNNVDNYLTIESPDEADRYYLVGGFPMGPWPLKIKPGGTPFRLRLRVAAAISSATGSPTSSFRLVIAPSLREAVVYQTLNDDNVYRFTATSTTPQIVTGTSGGTLNASTYVQVSAEQARSWTRTITVPNAVSGGDPRTIEQCTVGAWLWASTTAVGSLPRLHGLYLAEYHHP